MGWYPAPESDEEREARENRSTFEPKPRESTQKILDDAKRIAGIHERMKAELADERGSADGATTRTVEELLGRELSPEEFEFSYLWESDRPMIMRCVMEFTPDDFGWGAHPDYPAECSLVACFVEGDISELLNMKQIGIIEASALRKHKDDLQEAHDDRRIERYNDRQQEEN